MLVLLSSCQKELNEIDYIYVGSWGSKTYSIEIWENGRGILEKRGSLFLSTEVDARVKITDNEIKFKTDLWAKKFHIDEKPAFDSITNKTYMKLDGEVFFRH